MAKWVVYPHKEPSKEATALAEQVERDDGQVLAIYQDPVGERWQIFCLLPLDKVHATPYQRDLSPAHVKRLAEAVKKTGRFVDPIVAMSPSPGSTGRRTATTGVRFSESSRRGPSRPSSSRSVRSRSRSWRST